MSKRRGSKRSRELETRIERLEHAFIRLGIAWRDEFTDVLRQSSGDYIELLERLMKESR